MKKEGIGPFFWSLSSYIFSQTYRVNDCLFEWAVFCHFVHVFLSFWGHRTSRLLLIFNLLISAFKSLISIVNNLQSHYIITIHWFLTFHELLCNLRQNLILVHCSIHLTLPVLEVDWHVAICLNLTLTISTDIIFITLNEYSITSCSCKNSFTIFFNHSSCEDRIYQVFSYWNILQNFSYTFFNHSSVARHIREKP